MLEGTSWINQCQRVADLYGVSWDDFASWNGNLGDIRTPNCVFDPKMRYCGKQYAGDPAPEPTPPDYTLPIRVCLPSQGKESSLTSLVGWCD